MTNPPLKPGDIIRFTRDPGFSYLYKKPKVGTCGVFLNYINTMFFDARQSGYGYLVNIQASQQNYQPHKGETWLVSLVNGEIYLTNDKWIEAVEEESGRNS
jgi:hypothetical protein